jgi:hypothetical protein
MKHTPGPWILKADLPLPENGNEWKWINHKGTCVTFIVANPNRCTPMDEQRANAHLIAASPDLLEACKALANVISEWDGEWQRQCGSDFVDAYGMLIAAIAKADPEATA